MPTNTKQTELERVENTNWLDKEVGDAHDKARDYFTKGDMAFIHTQIKEAEERGRRSGIVSMTKKIRPILRWLFGYTDFPMRKDGEGAYWWRTYLREKLKKNGLYHLSPLLTDKIK